MRSLILSFVLSAATSTSAASLIVSNHSILALSNTVSTTSDASQTSSQSLAIFSSDETATITPTPTITGTFGWQTDGVSIAWPTDTDNSVICTTYGEWSTARGPCFAWCLNSACSETASSVAATCAPQWESYIEASQKWVEEHPATTVTSYVTITNTSLQALYTSTSTASEVTWTSRHFQLGIEDLSVENYNPVYVFGKPTGTSSVYSTTTLDKVQSYWAYSENGVSTTATQSPFPTPPPFCDVTSVSPNFLGPDNCTEYINHCKINGGTVKLYYWPDQATSAAANVIATSLYGNMSAVNTGPVLATVSGFTMTSPTVYISLAEIYATDYCGQRIGSDYAGRIIPMNPGDVSSVARQGPYYIYGESPASPFNYADLQGVVPAQAWADANMCWDTACYTITNDEYRPYLSIPPEIYALDPGWADCNPNFEGLYDPPLALTTAASVAVPTYPKAQPKIKVAMATPAGSPAPLSAATPTPQVTPNEEPAFHYEPQPPASRLSNEHRSSAGPDFSFNPHHEPSHSPSSENHHNANHAHASNAHEEETHSTPVAIGDIIAGGLGMTYDNAAPTHHPSSHGQQSSSPAQTHDAAPAPAITIGSQAYTRVPSNNDDADRYIIEGQTLHQNEAITASGTTISLGPAGSMVVVNGQTQDLEVPEPTNISPAGEASSAIHAPSAHGTPQPVGVVIDGQTVRPGETATIAGATIALDAGNNYVVIDGSKTEQLSTMPTETPTPKVDILTIGSETYIKVGGASAGFTINGETLHPGQVITADGTTIALAKSDGVVVIDGTVTQTLQTLNRPASNGTFVFNPNVTATATTTHGPFSPLGSVAQPTSPEPTSGAAGWPSLFSTMSLILFLLWAGIEVMR